MYVPKKKVLDKYASLLVNFALNSGEGAKPGEVIFLQIPESAKPFLFSLQEAILKAKCHPIIQFTPDGLSKHFYQLASIEQVRFFPNKYLKSRVETIDHLIHIDSEADPKELESADPKMLMEREKFWKPYREWRDAKENQGKLTWTIALFPTEAMAREAHLSLKEYWQQVIKACYLDYPNPIQKWKAIFREQERVKAKLNSLEIEKVNIKSKHTNLTIGLGEKRLWNGGSGRNIPSFELFTSPDCRIAEGHIFFDQPLYRYGNLIKDVYLEFKNGKVVKAKAKKGESVLKEMIKTKNADRMGEFSLTDKRVSRISKFMATTLFDENFGGKYGNTHIALGKAYKDCYPGDPSKIKNKEWNSLGYNQSAIHTDIISTENRTVTATLKSGKKLIIYKNGKFTV